MKHRSALCSTTGLRLSAAWLASENVRAVRERQKADYMVASSPSLEQHIAVTVMESNVVKAIETKRSQHER